MDTAVLECVFDNLLGADPIPNESIVARIDKTLPWGGADLEYDEPYPLHDEFLDSAFPRYESIDEDEWTWTPWTVRHAVRAHTWWARRQPGKLASTRRERIAREVDNAAVGCLFALRLVCADANVTYLMHEQRIIALRFATPRYLRDVPDPYQAIGMNGAELRAAPPPHVVNESLMRRSALHRAARTEAFYIRAESLAKLLHLPFRTIERLFIRLCDFGRRLESTVIVYTDRIAPVLAPRWRRGGMDDEGHTFAAVSFSVAGKTGVDHVLDATGGWEGVLHRREKAAAHLARARAAARVSDGERTSAGVRA
jgi:hypothetical protein